MDFQFGLQWPKEIKRKIKKDNKYIKQVLFNDKSTNLIDYHSGEIGKKREKETNNTKNKRKKRKKNNNNIPNSGDDTNSCESESDLDTDGDNQSDERVKIVEPDDIPSDPLIEYREKSIYKIYKLPKRISLLPGKLPVNKFNILDIQFNREKDISKLNMVTKRTRANASKYIQFYGMFEDHPLTLYCQFFDNNTLCNKEFRFNDEKHFKSSSASRCRRHIHMVHSYTNYSNDTFFDHINPLKVDMVKGKLKLLEKELSEKETQIEGERLKKIEMDRIAKTSVEKKELREKNDNINNGDINDDRECVYNTHADIMEDNAKLIEELAKTKLEKEIMEKRLNVKINQFKRARDEAKDLVKQKVQEMKVLQRQKLKEMKEYEKKLERAVKQLEIEKLREAKDEGKRREKESEDKKKKVIQERRLENVKKTFEDGIEHQQLQENNNNGHEGTDYFESHSTDELEIEDPVDLEKLEELQRVKESRVKSIGKENEVGKQLAEQNEKDAANLHNQITQHRFEENKKPTETIAEVKSKIINDKFPESSHENNIKLALMTDSTINDQQSLHIYQQSLGQQEPHEKQQQRHSHKRLSFIEISQAQSLYPKEQETPKNSCPQPVIASQQYQLQERFPQRQQPKQQRILQYQQQLHYQQQQLHYQQQHQQFMAQYQQQQKEHQQEEKQTSSSSNNNNLL